MDVNWGKYYLRDVPFVELPAVSPRSRDDRINGKIFSKSGYAKQYQELIDFIRRERSICYVRAETDVLGAGKSALMAAVYWGFKNDPAKSKTYLPVWVDVVDFRNVTQLLGRVLDTLVFEQVVDDIKSKITNLSPSSIEKFLKKEMPQPSPSAILAVSRILQVPREELAYKYVNIRRSISTVSAVEIFQYIMMLYKLTRSRRALIFIDQFEEYVAAQRGSAGARRLGNDMNDIIRTLQNTQNLTFVLTLHPESEIRLEAAAPQLETFGTFEETSVTIGDLKPDDLVEMAAAYLDHFRTEKPPKDIDPLFPFDRNAIVYLAKESKNIPRVFLRFLHNAMIEAALVEAPRITQQFLKQPEILLRVGIVAG